MDLRSAVRSACHIGATFGPDEIATLADVPRDRALAYCRLLVRQSVLTECDGAQFDRGEGFGDWSKTRTASGGGQSSYGNGAKYQREKAVRDALRQRAWQQGRGKEPKPPKREKTMLDELRLPSGYKRPPQVYRDVRTRLMLDGLLPVTRVAEILGISRITVWREVRRGKLKAVRVARRALAINEYDLIAYVRELNAKEGAS